MKLKLSATRISTYLQCKYRYWLNYVKKEPKIANPAFSLGLACHSTLEYAGNLWKDKNLSTFTKKHKKEILKVYDKEAIKEGIQDYAGFAEGKAMVSDRINNFKLGQKIIGLEIAFGFRDGIDIETSQGVPLIGAIDKVVELDDRTIAVVDYKTSMTVPDANKLRKDVQLSMYNLVINQLYPNYDRVILSLDMLRKRELVYTYRSEKDLYDFEDYLSAVYNEMVQLKEKDVEPTLNFLCGWCDYRNICEAYNKACSKDSYTFSQLNSMSNEQLVSEWEQVRATKKILETREKELAGVMIDKIKVYEEPVQTKDKEMVLRQSSRTSYNTKKIKELIPYEDFADLATLSPTKFKRYLEKNVKLKACLEDICEVNYTSAFLASRKLKK